jgi:outer membrane receptor protein involved in Fe transport
LGGYGTTSLNAGYTWNLDSGSLKALKFDFHVDNVFNRHSPFYSAGLDTASTPNFLWMIYNEPMFASLSVTAKFF